MTDALRDLGKRPNGALVPATAVTEVPILHVLFKLDDATYALPFDVVLQMETYTGATVVPGAPSFVAGIIQLRGHVVPVIDLRARFGMTGADPKLERRVVVGVQHDRTVALLVDSAREVTSIAPSQLKPPPRFVGDGQTGFVKAVAQLGDRTVMVLDFGRVIGEEPLDV